MEDMPVYSSHLLRYEDLALGDRIRQQRARHNMTLRDLASRISASTARLSEIENGLYVPHLRQVLAIAEAFDISPSVLLPADVSVPYQIARERTLRNEPAQAIPPSSSAGGETLRSPGRFWPLADLFVGRHLEPLFGLIEPDSGPTPHLWRHHSEEFLFVLKGTLEFVIRTPGGLARETIGRGDCVYLRSDLPHGFRSLEAEPAETLQVLASGSPPLHPGADWLPSRASTFTQADDEGQATDGVGDRIRAIRETRGWTVQEVARIADIPLRRLHQIEEGLRDVPVNAVLRLAQVLGCPLAQLIGHAGEGEPAYTIQRSADIPGIPYRTRRTPVEQSGAQQSKTCQPLAGGFPARHMFPYFVRLLNVAAETLKLHEHHGHEFIYVLDGELELVTYAGDQQVTEKLHPGDSCYLDSSVPHLVHAQTRNPYSETSAEMLDIFWSPLGERYLFG